MVLCPQERAAVRVRFPHHVNPTRVTRPVRVACPGIDRTSPGAERGKRADRTPARKVRAGSRGHEECPGSRDTGMGRAAWGKAQGAGVKQRGKAPVPAVHPRTSGTLRIHRPHAVAEVLSGSEGKAAWRDSQRGDAARGANHSQSLFANNAGPEGP